MAQRLGSRIKDGCFYRTDLSLFGIMALQNLIVFSVNLADNVMLGRFSESAMSGVSLANQVQFLLQMLVTGTASGLIVLASQYWGKKQTEPIRRLFTVALIVAVCLAAALGAVVICFPEWVMSILTNEPEVIAQGAIYIRILGFTYIIFAVTNVILGVLRSVETVAVGFVIALSALITNIFLNYCLIFGNLGFPRLGVAGAAWATFAARVVEMIIAVVYLVFFDKKIGLKFREIFRLDSSYFRDFFHAGLPMVFSSASWGIAMFIQSAILGRLGAAAIGASSIANALFSFLGVISSSSQSASSVVIAKTVGEGDIPRVKRYARRLQLIFLATGLISSALFLSLKGPILSYYNVSDETLVLAGKFITILSITIVGSSYEAPCLCGIVAGGGETNFVLFNDLIFMWGIVLPMSALSAFVFKWPVTVTFFLLKGDQILKCAVAVIKVNRFRWIRVLTRETGGSVGSGGNNGDSNTINDTINDTIGDNDNTGTSADDPAQVPAE